MKPIILGVGDFYNIDKFLCALNQALGGAEKYHQQASISGLVNYAQQESLNRPCQTLRAYIK